MNLVGEKEVTDRCKKNIYIHLCKLKIKKTTKTTMYTSLPMCLHTKYTPKEQCNCVKAKAVESQVDKGWTTIRPK